MKMTTAKSLLRKRQMARSRCGQKGFALIEILIALAIFGVISVGFLSALVAGYHGVVVAHDQTMAQNLTRTEFENVRSATFPVVDYQTTTTKFDVQVEADYIDQDFGISVDPTERQKVTVRIKYHESGRTVLETEGLKVK